MAIHVTSDFELLVTKDGSSVLLDRENAVVKVSWIGKVGAETASYLFSKALNEIKEGNATSLLLDRSHLEEFSKGARLWIKEDFLTQRVKPFSHQITKVAAVKPTTSMGGIFSNLISAAIRIVMPFLAMAEFHSEKDAFNWLVDD